VVEADDIVLEALLDDVLDATVFADATEEALRLLQGDGTTELLDRVTAEIVTVTREYDRLIAAIASGGEIAGLLEALRARDARRPHLEAERAALTAQRPLKASETARIRGELMTLAGSWRHVLARDATNARPIVTALLTGRVTITPQPPTPKTWRLQGEGTLSGLFAKAIVALVVRPQGENQTCLGGCRAASSGRRSV
jgi:hypothetical protein